MKALMQSTRGALALGAGALVLLTLAGWFLLVSPQRSKASDLEQQVAAAQTTLVQRQAALRNPSVNVHVKAGDTYRLTKALPDTGDMAGVILDVQRLAGRNGLDFSSISPAPATVGTSGYTTQPIAITVQGRFGTISRFLGDLRSLVRVRHGRLDARGRLYSVSQIDVGKPGDKAEFPVVLATVTLNAFTFTAPVPPAATPTPSTPSSSSGTIAAVGATP